MGAYYPDPESLVGLEEVANLLLDRPYHDIGRKVVGEYIKHFSSAPSIPTAFWLATLLIDMELRQLLNALNSYNLILPHERTLRYCCCNLARSSILSTLLTSRARRRGMNDTSILSVTRVLSAGLNVSMIYVVSQINSEDALVEPRRIRTL